MIKSISRIWNFLSLQGTEGHAEPSAKRIRLINQACIVISAISVFFFFVWMIEGNPLMVASNVLMIAIHGGFIYLNRLRYYAIPKFFIFIVLSTALFWASGSLGAHSSLHYSLISIAGFSVLLFDPKEKYKIFFSIAYPMLLLSILIFYDFNVFPNHIGKNLKLVPAIEYAISIMVVLVTTLYLYFSNTKTQDKYQVLFEQHVESQKLIDEERARAMYASKMASLGEMAAGIAHEIKSPLSIITIYSDLINRDLVKKQLDEEKLKDHMDKINQTSMMISNIVTALSNISRNSENAPASTTPVKTLVDEALFICSHRFHLGSVRLTYHLPDNLPPVLCRPVDVGQVLVNLLNNAYDATSSNTNGLVHISAKVVDQDIHLAVEDNGHGIPSEIRNRIFENFFTTKISGKGTGLGLSISKKIMISNSGNLILDESSDRTKFVCVLKTS